MKNPPLTMWFKRKPTNRRLTREHVLDVKLRSSKVKAARNRLAILALAVILLVVCGGYLLWRTSRWALDQYVYQNPAFAVEQIDVQTDGVIALDQIRRWAGVRPGLNLLALDLARVKRDLELVPLIDSVSVERVMPHTLRIRIVEREPIAQVNCLRAPASGDSSVAVYQLDAAGWVLLPLDAAQRAQPAQTNDPLPALVGVDSRVLQPGRRIDSSQVAAALQLVLCFDNSPMAGLVDLKSIDVSVPEVLVATTGQGSEITFGLTDLDRQLRRWHEIFDLGQKHGRVLANVDLAVTNNIPVRWLDASVVPTSNPKPLKPPRLRRVHV